MSIQIRVLLLLAFVCLASLLVACDAVAEYTVDNETDKTLITRALFEEDCAVTGGRASDYLPEQVVEPNSRFEYIEVYGGGGPDAISCIQVLDTNRRLVLGEKYRGGGVYSITKPLAPTGEPAPDLQTLPEHSDFGQWKEDLSERPVGTAITLFGIGLVLALWFAFVFVLPLGVVVCLFILARNFVGRLRARTD